MRLGGCGKQAASSPPPLFATGFLVREQPLPCGEAWTQACQPVERSERALNTAEEVHDAPCGAALLLHLPQCPAPRSPLTPLSHALEQCLLSQRKWAARAPKKRKARASGVVKQRAWLRLERASGSPCSRELSFLCLSKHFVVSYQDRKDQDKKPCLTQ